MEHEHERDRIIAALRKIPNGFTNEAALQRAVASTLLDLGKLIISAEHRITSADRIDFLVSYDWPTGDLSTKEKPHVGSYLVGIECKVKGPESHVWRQLLRYGKYLDTIVLVTTKPFKQIPTLPIGANLIMVDLWRNI